MESRQGCNGLRVLGGCPGGEYPPEASPPQQPPKHVRLRRACVVPLGAGAVLLRLPSSFAASASWFSVAVPASCRQMIREVGRCPSAALVRVATVVHVSIEVSSVRFVYVFVGELSFASCLLVFIDLFGLVCF